MWKIYLAEGIVLVGFAIMWALGISENDISEKDESLWP